MKIIIGDKRFTIYVKEKHLKGGELYENSLPLDIWCMTVGKKVISSLFEVEEVLSDALQKPVKLNDGGYEKIRKPILNLSGSVSRLSSNLSIVEDEEHEK